MNSLIRCGILAIVLFMSAPAKSDNPSIQNFFNALNINTLLLIDSFYAPDVQFIDPMGEIRGREKVKAYYQKMYKDVTAIRFDFSDEIVQGNDHVVTWTMYVQAKNLNGGEPVSLPGISHIRFQNGLAAYHRDYFDMGVFVYEHIPVLGRLIRFIRGRLAH